MPRARPTFEEINLPNVGGPRPVASYDVSAFGQGAQALAKSVVSLGQDIQKGAKDIAEVTAYRDRTNALLSEDKILNDAIELRQKYRHDTNFDTMGERHAQEQQAVVEQGI